MIRWCCSSGRRATAHAAQVMDGVSTQLGADALHRVVRAGPDRPHGRLTGYLLAALAGRDAGAVAGARPPTTNAGRAGARRPRRAGALDRTCLSPLGFEWTIEQPTAGTFMDNLIHTWDLATATGQDAALDPELVEACIAMFLPEMPERAAPAVSSAPSVTCPTTRRRRIGSWPRWDARP